MSRFNNKGRAIAAPQHRVTRASHRACSSLDQRWVPTIAGALRTAWPFLANITIWAGTFYEIGRLG